MINPHLCYRKICEAEFLQSYFYTNLSSFEWFDYYGWEGTPIDEDIYLQEPLINKINDLGYEMKGCGFLKMNPYRQYNWHCDAKRKVSVNMIMTPDIKYYTLFGNSTESEDQFEFVTMEYEANTMYLFNTTMMHSIINFDKPRYLFTIEFEDENLRYEELYERLQL